MPTARARPSDIKVLVGATLAVLMAGFLIAGGLLIATRGSKNIRCGQLNLGSATNIRQTLQSEGAELRSGGGSCSFWIALDQGDIVAYRVNQPGCVLQLKDQGRRWECGGRTLQAADLTQYPVSIQRVGSVDSVVVDLGPTTSTT
ncbi:MAG TPA: hypothetical protein VFR41_03045 [Acidimicrobiia bacterium]|nr:hypothetical protein [Acidimicrobiia bacterium]